MQYATLQLMQALGQTGAEVVNFASGWQGLANHRHILNQENIPSVCLPLPEKFIRLLNNFKIHPENFLLGNFDYYFQVGLQMKRNIPKEKLLLGIHDIVPLRYPEGEMPFPDYALELISSAKKIITVSDFSKKELISEFKIAPDKIAVIANGIDQQRFNAQKNPLEFKHVQKKYGLPDRYLLCFGGNAKRKNIDRLCRAVSSLKIPLVVFGGYQPEKNYANVLVLNYLPEGEVEIILKNAFIFVFPSYYEGFGLPVIEAMACGVPVVCANTASLPEVSGGCALLFNPFEETEITAKIRQLSADAELRRSNISKGLQWGRNFSWEAAGRKLLAILKK